MHLIQCFFARDPLTGERCILINEIDISMMKGVQVDLILSKQRQEQFLASVSHELRTPLNGIIGLSESLVFDPETSAVAKKTLRTIMSSGHRLMTLVNDILDMTSMRENRFVLNYERVQFHEVAEHVIKSIQVMVARGVKLINEVPSDLPPFVSDAGRLSQIITNLLGNSVKFTHEGTITLRASTIGTKFVVISVHDTGIGIPQEQFRKIFEPFVKGDTPSKWNYSGSGLGLSVVSQLVSAFGGFISLESSQDPKDHGSVFTVKLPMGLHNRTEEELATTAENMVNDRSEAVRDLLTSKVLNKWTSESSEQQVAHSLPEVPHDNQSCVALLQIGSIPFDADERAMGSGP